MAGTITIELNKIRFFADHGLYAEELKTGNNFELSLAVSFTTDRARITGVNDTIDYQRLYDLVKAEVKLHRDLLETLAMELAEKIYERFPATGKVEVSISKLHPPIEGFEGNIRVHYSKEF
jgi:dihydroneopterin aldolase